MRRMLAFLRDWCETNHRRVVEQSDDQFRLTLVQLLALIPALLGLSMVAGGSMMVNVVLIAAMGAVSGFMLALLRVRAKGESNRS